MGFEPRTSGIGSDRSTNWATTTALKLFLSFEFQFMWGAASVSVMSDPPLSRASAAFEESGEISDSAASGRESQESGENFLCSQGGWRSEAESVIRDVQKFVKKIEIAEKIQVCFIPFRRALLSRNFTPIFVIQTQISLNVYFSFVP